MNKREEEKILVEEIIKSLPEFTNTSISKLKTIILVEDNKRNNRK